MPKFYVQSGNLEMVLQAHDPRCAAIWAVHRTLSQSLPFLCEDPVDYLSADDTGRLGEIIRVNERGFDSADSVVFDTLNVIAEWNHLLVALDKLYDAVDCQPQSDNRANS